MSRFPALALGALACAACVAIPARGQTPLARQVGAIVAEPAVARDHWGVMVTAMDGTPLYALNEAQLFQPASNAKLFTTASAMALLGPETTFETRVAAYGTYTSANALEGDLYLIGGGDANLSGRTVPYPSPAERAALKSEHAALKKDGPPAHPLRYLEELATQVAATGLQSVSGDIVGDDPLFRYEPYAPDWSIDDAVWGYGAPVSALTVNDNQIKLTVTPGAHEGLPSTIMMEPPLTYYTVDGTIATGAAKSGNTVHIERGDWVEDAAAVWIDRRRCGTGG